MSGSSGRPKYNDTFIDYREPHILRAPYQSVVIPRSEMVNPDDVANETTDTSEYTSDFFNVIPTGTNIAASIGYGHGPMNSNAGIKRYHKPGDAMGGYRPEPFWVPEGGWAIDWSDAKLPEDYYAENRRGTRYVELPENLEHWEDPLVMFPGSANPSAGIPRLRERDVIPIVPTAVYEVEEVSIGSAARPLVYKGSTSVTGMSVDFEAEALPNPMQVAKYIQNKNLLSILPPVYSTYIKMDNQIIPLKLKDPRYLAIQAQDSAAIDIPLPNGNSVKLRDYRWTVVQNINSETELIFEIPPQLKNRPDISHSVSQITAAFEGYIEKKDGKISDKRINTVNTAPIVDQVYNQFLASGAVPELAPSKTYYTVDNALEVFPGGLAPVRAELREKPKLYAQPEPAATAPWFF